MVRRPVQPKPSKPGQRVPAQHAGKPTPPRPQRPTRSTNQPGARAGQQGLKRALPRASGNGSAAKTAPRKPREVGPQPARSGAATSGPIKLKGNRVQAPARQASVIDLASRRQVRRTGLRVVGVLLLIAALIGAGLWLVVWSEHLRVRTVEVTGSVEVPTELIRHQGERVLGEPLALVNLAEINNQTERIPRVRTAWVSRKWPTTLRIEVTERIPFAAVPGVGGKGWRVVDEEGVVLAQVDEPAANLPRVQVNDLSDQGDRVRSAVQVLTSLPPTLRELVVHVGATTGDGVRLRLREGPTVFWGDSGRSEDKARVLAVLMGNRKAVEIDVSAPDFPVTKP